MPATAGAPTALIEGHRLGEMASPRATFASTPASRLFFLTSSFHGTPLAAMRRCAAKMKAQDAFGRSSHFHHTEWPVAISRPRRHTADDAPAPPLTRLFPAKRAAYFGRRTMTA